MTGMSNTLHSLKPTSRRPLHGLMVLLVEDSLTAGEAVRLICITSGARLRRADCIESARRHLRIYRPDVAIVDMGLPDGDGAVLISELAQANPRTQTIIGLSADPNRAKAAMEAGADSFIEKPLNSIAGFQNAILMNLPHHRRPMDIRLLPDLAFEADQRATGGCGPRARITQQPRKGRGAIRLSRSLYRWRGPHSLRSNFGARHRAIFKHAEPI